MAQTTYAHRVNSYIERVNPRIPFTSTFFAGSQSISRISNGQNRPTYLWHDANKFPGEQTVLRTLSWVCFNLGWHIDHIVPVVKGGSYNVSNLRALPPSLNLFISDSGEWSHEELNEFIDHLTPKWCAKLGIPEGFKSLPVEEFLKSDFLAELLAKKKSS